MKKVFWFLSLFLFFFFVGWGYVNYKFYWSKPLEGSSAFDFEIKAGDSLSSVAKNLAEKNIIDNQWLFKFYFKSKGLDKKIPAGFFKLPAGMSYQDLAKLLANPEDGSIKVLFREGENIRDYGNILEKNGFFTALDFQKIVGQPAVDYRFEKNETPPKDFSAEFSFLEDKPKYIGLEGYLFPDTYLFKEKTNPEEVARTMLRNFDKKLTEELRAEIQKQGKDIHQIITMASIVEAEARGDADRKIVAGILWKREAIGMALQVDSSVNYITGESKPAISYDEQKTDSLYNTYKYPGLPPGPINNPSLSAIMATIYPNENDYWFFLTGNDGKMYYAKTLEEHNKYKYKYLK